MVDIVVSYTSAVTETHCNVPELIIQTLNSYCGDTTEDTQEPSSLLCSPAPVVLILFSHGKEWKPVSHVLVFPGT